jgi:hypothetical protein
MEQTAVFNQAQMHILQMMSYIKTPEELEDLQNVISDYYAKKVDDEMDMLCEQGVIDAKTIEEWGKEHLRTAYV